MASSKQKGVSRRTFLKTTFSGMAAAGLLPILRSGKAFAAEPAPPADSGAGLEPIATGKFQPTWESLAQYEAPEWFRDAKFGIWAHWTAQCVPEQGDWYARNMYPQYSVDKNTSKKKLNPVHKWHVDHYGHPSKVGFKDIDNLWHAEKWEPEQLIDLYKQAGARYFVALANHHDNFDCFDSKYQKWNSVNIGPKKDIVGAWAKAARAAGLRFGVTVHAARSWDWFDVSHGSDEDGPMAGVPYDGILTKADGKGTWWEGYDPAELYSPTGAARTPEARLAYDRKFFNRVVDLVNQHHPDLLYFDDGVMPLNGRPGDYGLKIAAHFYNSSTQWHGENQAVMNCKGLNEQQRKCLVRDIERGKNGTIDPNPWQTDTCIGGWHYSRSLFERHRYKKASEVIPMLVDIVSKNGNLLLNIPLRGDGSIDEDELAFLKEMARWMAINSECIYGTRPWKVYGEGPSTTVEVKGHFGGQADVSNTPFTSEDIRFTTKGDTLYAIALGWPADGKLTIKSLAAGAVNSPAQIQSVQLFGASDKIAFTRTATGLELTLPAAKPCDTAYVFKIGTTA